MLALGALQVWQIWNSVKVRHGLPKAGTESLPRGHSATKLGTSPIAPDSFHRRHRLAANAGGDSKKAMPAEVTLRICRYRATFR